MLRKYFLFGVLLMLAVATASAKDFSNYPGWYSVSTSYSYKNLIKRVNSAAKSHKMGLVTKASATVGARKLLDKKIPGNMVIGIYHARFAVPMLEASIAAGIEAPIRVYITENEDHTATVSYKTPSAVFEPYMEEGDEKLKVLATELDKIFASIVKDAAGS